MTDTVDSVAVGRAVASLAKLADRYTRTATLAGGTDEAQALHVLRLSYNALGVVLGGSSTPNERADMFMSKLNKLVPQLTDNELVGAYNVVNLPGLLADGEAWELVEAELTKRDIQVPGPYTTGDTTEVRRPSAHSYSCDCEDQVELIYDNCPTEEHKS